MPVVLLTCVLEISLPCNYNIPICIPLVMQPLLHPASTATAACFIFTTPLGWNFVMQA